MKKSMDTEGTEEAGSAPLSELQKVLKGPIHPLAKGQVEIFCNLMKLKALGAPGNDRVGTEWHASMNEEVPPENLLSHVEHQCLLGHKTRKERLQVDSGQVSGHPMWN